MSQLYDRDLYASAIFDVQDRFLADRKISGVRPRPLGTVKFLLIERETDGAFQPLPTPQAMQVRTNLSGYRLFFGRVVAETTVYRLTPGRYRASIRSDYYLPDKQTLTVFTPSDETGIDLPMPVDLDTTIISVDLEPALNYPFPTRTTRLYGAYLRPGPDGNEVPMHNAIVQAFDANDDVLSGTWTTNAKGDWLLIFNETRLAALPEVEEEVRLPDGTILSRIVIPVWIRFISPDGGGIQNNQVNIVRYAENKFKTD